MRDFEPLKQLKLRAIEPRVRIYWALYKKACNNKKNNTWHNHDMPSKYTLFKNKNQLNLNL